jgi:hypothetical protein
MSLVLPGQVVAIAAVTRRWPLFVSTRRRSTGNYTACNKGHKFNGIYLFGVNLLGILFLQHFLYNIQA